MDVWEPSAKKQHRSQRVYIYICKIDRKPYKQPQKENEKETSPSLKKMQNTRASLIHILILLLEI